MPRTSYGDEKRSQAWKLVEALILARNRAETHSTTVNNVQLSAPNWHTAKQPELEVQATLKDLASLSSLSIDQVRESLTQHLAQHLEILEDRRLQKAGRNAGNWLFILRLWSIDLQENQRQFNQNWELRKTVKAVVPQHGIAALIQQIRKQQCPKLMTEYGKIQLPLTRQRVEVNDLYVDVYVLTRLTRDYWATVRDLWQHYDWQRDRAGLGQRVGNREDGETLVKQDQYRRTVVLGKPGSGKSTFMQRLVVGCINGELFADRIPVLVLLRKINAETFQIPAYLQQAWRISDSELGQILDSGKVLLLLDGLDEVPGQFQARIKQDVEQFACTYPQVGIIVTCRTQTVEYGLNTFEFLEVADFKREQVEQFAQNWFRANDATTAADQTKQFMAALDTHPAIAELAITPILLGLSCLLWRDRGNLPARRGELYEQGIELLLREWDAYREINRACESETYRNLSIEQRQDLLGFIALQKFQEPENFVLFEQQELKQLVSRHLKISPFESEKILTIIEEHHGLLIRRAHQVYSFSHLTFQEYFVARELTRLNNDQLLSQITDKKWQEVFRLAISRMKDPSDLLWRTKQHIDQQLAKDTELQQFLQWVDEKARSISAPYKQAAIRAFYFAFDLTFADTTARVLELVHKFDLALVQVLAIIDSDRNPFRALARFFDIDSALIIARTHTRNSALTLANNDPFHDFALSNVLARTCTRDLIRAITLANTEQCDLELLRKFEELCTQLPNFAADLVVAAKWWRQQGENWVTQLRQVMIDYRNIGYDWQFSEAQREKLQQYYDANKLLINLLKGDSVSEELRQEIEDTLLLPLSELNQQSGTPIKSEENA